MRAAILSLASGLHSSQDAGDIVADREVWLNGVIELVPAVSRRDAAYAGALRRLQVVYKQRGIFP